LSGASASELTNAKNYIATSSTATGSETTLSRDTWGVGKTASAFSGLPAYAADISSITPFYTGTTSASYDFYYGVNVSTAKTPGTYTGEVLYTVLMDSACTSYTLNFNGNFATTNTLTSRDIAFDDTIDLSTISSSSVIARTGYTLTGWKDQNNNSYGITGTVDVNPDDLSSVTLTAQWQINSNNVTVSKGTNVTTVSGTNSYDYNSTVTISATAFSTGYHFSGWTVNSGGVTLYSNSSMTTTSTTSTPAYFKMPDNDVKVTANAAANTYTIAYNGNGSTSGSTSSQTSQAYGSNVTLRANGFTRTNYTFLGWSHSSSATTATYSASTSYAVSTLASGANVTGTNGATITLYAVWSSGTNCSNTVHPTTTTGCKMADGNTWIYGNSGNTLTWGTLCSFTTAYTEGNCKTSTYCPSGYKLPSNTTTTNLVKAYNGGVSNSEHGAIYNGSEIYNLLGLSATRSYWTTTCNAWSSYAFNFSVANGDTRAYWGDYSSQSYYVLCYK
ncbi:InlB B-repeat-containing protein, partial [Candidatus Saccharibacteria bacterium]|nr:InlB B-repeat-containing protein [Candidatus Saccharibacteria bacterium]